jgi:hypothetical protein
MTKSTTGQLPQLLLPGLVALDRALSVAGHVARQARITHEAVNGSIGG